MRYVLEAGSHTASIRAKLIGNACVVMLCCLLVGCRVERFTSKRGDLRSFLEQALDRYGATAGQGKDESWRGMTTTWRYLFDEDGFQICADTNCFDEVDAFFRARYGAPALPTDNTVSSNPFVVYRIEQAGIAIQYYLHDENHTTHILCINLYRNLQQRR